MDSVRPFISEERFVLKHAKNDDINILVVIPNAGILTSAVTVLRDLDPRFSLIGTTDPFEALALLMARDFDALVCTFDMPRMNGERLVREIAGDLGSPTAIFLAPAGRAAAHQAAHTLGVRHVIATLEPEALRVAVTDAAARTHRCRALGSGLHDIDRFDVPELSTVEIRSYLHRVVVDLKPLIGEAGRSPGSQVIVRPGADSPTLQVLRKSSIANGRPFQVFRLILRRSIERWLSSHSMDSVLIIPVEGHELFAPDLVTATSLPWALRRSIVFSFHIDSTDLRALRQAHALQQAGYRVAVFGGATNPGMLMYMRPNYSLAGSRLETLHQSERTPARVVRRGRRN